jgi:RNA polymerase sigma-70 factor, ECF subfamily
VVEDDFSAHRDHLMAVAYRMLGSRAEAEDAVQEAWIRYANADTDDVKNLRAWLTTATGRICLDVLRSARVRREAYVGPWLPEPYVERLPSTDTDAEDPAEKVVLAERISIALLLVLETLNPEQRVAFVLHDVFAVPFNEVAATLGTSVDNARQLASRARRTVATGQRRHTADLTQQRWVYQAFMDAVSGGDLDALLKLLAPDVVAIGDGGGIARAARSPVVGALKVARFIMGSFRLLERASDTTVEQVLVNGDVGLRVESRDPSMPAIAISTMSIGEDGLITGIYNLVNPEKLVRVGPGLSLSPDER